MSKLQIVDSILFLLEPRVKIWWSHVTVTGSQDIEKDVEDSGINNII